MKPNNRKPEDDYYREAIRWKQRAERWCSPAEFRIAADYFERAGRITEADYCNERADYYSRAR